MDYAVAIDHIYDHIENGHVDKAVMGCLRIARNLNDYMYTAIFLREMYPVKRDFRNILYDDTSHLKEDVQKYLFEQSLEHWIDSRTLNFSFGTNDKGEEKTLLALSVGVLDRELEQLERIIQDLTIPPGMGEFDTAAFTDRYNDEKSQLRLRINAIYTIKDRIKTRCLNYAIRIERQLQAQQKSISFLGQIQNDVNNYFATHSEDVYKKLQKAAELIDNNDQENLSLLLTQVRRAIKSSADYFYPPSLGPVKCADGTIRDLDDKQYLNRLNEFLITAFEKSSSRDLLKAELEQLSVFARRLNEVASKGIHATVSGNEAKQGLLGLYMFLYNICSRLQEKDSQPDGGAQVAR
jgi:hypothetical protein